MGVGITVTYAHLMGFVILWFELYKVAPSWCLWWTYIPICFFIFTKVCLIISMLEFQTPPCWSSKLSESSQFRGNIKSRTGLMWNADIWLANLTKTACTTLSLFEMLNWIAKFNSWKLIMTKWIPHQHSINAITTYFNI